MRTKNEKNKIYKIKLPYDVADALSYALKKNGIKTNAYLHAIVLGIVGEGIRIAGLDLVERARQTIRNPRSSEAKRAKAMDLCELFVNAYEEATERYNKIMRK
ncbi:MAG: hypothetical protein LIO91_09490 [Bacteroidales bacterium]|nr:hypothetical protein [Bacteroidales bacterium]